MTAILGISAFYHDSAAALLVDGKLVAAAQEERFTRKKHDAAFPARAIEYCLSEAGLASKDLDFVGFYEKPYLRFERLLETYLAFAPAGFPSFLRAMPTWLREKLHLPRIIRKGLNDGYSKKIVFVEHHESHAASAFFPSPFESSAIVTMDGVGEWATSSMGYGEGNKITLDREMRFPHSLGLLYSAFTYFTGFRVNSGEYKLMGLAPYGEPRFVDLIFEKVLDLKEDGSFRLDLSLFNYCQGLTMTSPKMNELFGGPPRLPESDLSQREMDIAASIQKVTEEVVLRTVRTAHERSQSKNLVLAGGVALNCVANGRILREGPFENLWVQPASGDAGGALGVAMLIWHQLLDEKRVPEPTDSQHGSLLGPKFSPQEIVELLESVGAIYEEVTDEDLLCEQIAVCIASEQVVGWMQGRMEYGPRALGGRSILGDPRSQKMQSVMNLKIKFRESFRPFAPSVLAEKAPEFFDIQVGQSSPYMTLVAPVRADKCLETPEETKGLEGLDKLQVARSVVPAITHVDSSARIQTVDADRSPRYHKLIKAFEGKTGCPLVINTSFNVRGEPIVCTPLEAYECFMTTDMDVLVLEDFVLKKAEQPEANRSRQSTPTSYGLD